VIKYNCKRCGGSSYCHHGKSKKHCRDCDGVSLCIHRRVKIYCKLCEGSSICEHDKIRYQCRECGGKRFCKHGKNKAYCKECGGRQLCKSPHCTTTKSTKFDGYCLQCYINANPNAEITRNHKTTEKAVAAFVKQTFPSLPWVCDRRLAPNKSRRRPDIYAIFESFILIVEVDENQHDCYDASDENKRLQQLQQDANGKPLAFIRFNPDQYLDEHRNKVKSCWRKYKDGILRLSTTMTENWSKRLELLRSSIQFWISVSEGKYEGMTFSSTTIEVSELFFDGTSADL